MRISGFKTLLCFGFLIGLLDLSTMSFSRAKADTAIPASPENGGPRRWEVIVEALPVYVAPSVDASQVAAFDKGEVLQNAGCTEVQAQLWCEVKPLSGGPMGHVLHEELQPARGPDGQIATGKDNSKARARKGDFDASGRIDCAQEAGQSLGTCRASVARGGGGDATVVVSFANGFKRDLYFIHGRFVSASATMSGVGTDTEERLVKGIHVIRVDDQSYEIADEFVLGIRRRAD